MNRVGLEHELCLFFSGETHIEFCCHLARGNIDPKEPPIYEYVKFVGDFKFHNNGEDRSSFLETFNHIQVFLDILSMVQLFQLLV